MNGWATILLIFLLIFATIIGCGYLFSELENTRIALNEARSQNEHLANQLVSLKEQSTAQGQALTSCSTDLDQAKMERDTAIERLNSNQARIQTLESELEQAAIDHQAYVSSVTEELSTLRQRVPQLEHDLEQSNVALDQANASLLAGSQNYELATRTIATLESKNSELATHCNTQPNASPVLDHEQQKWSYLIPSLSFLVLAGYSGYQRWQRRNNPNRPSRSPRPDDRIWVQMTREQARNYARQCRRQGTG